MPSPHRRDNIKIEPLAAGELYCLCCYMDGIDSRYKRGESCVCGREYNPDGLSPVKAYNEYLRKNGLEKPYRVIDGKVYALV